MYSVSTICEIISGNFLQRVADSSIIHLALDSRRLPDAPTSLFFAIVTEHNNGHMFVEDAYKKGVRNFVVSETVKELPGANLILVRDTLAALQQLASLHRTKFSIPVIGITGSNGKTIVKEWLYQLMQDDHHIVRSPRSFNSQIGVPLSVWQMNEEHTLAIFEAGISRPGEMEKLAEIIRPSIGVLTNIGEAHSEGFKDNRQKTDEKIRLFENAELVVMPGDADEVFIGTGHSPKRFTWGYNEQNDFRILSITKKSPGTAIEAIVNQNTLLFKIPFTDQASVENAISCFCVMLVLGYETGIIKERMARLHAIDMRLQLKHSFNDCLLINDSYSADLTSLKIALEFLKQQSSGLKRTVIISEFVESGFEEKKLYRQIAGLLKAYAINKVIAVGEKIGEVFSEQLGEEIQLIQIPSTDDFVNSFRSSLFSREIILIKGARRFEFERIARVFEKKLHQTVLEINLDALAHNLKEYQKMLKPGTKVMAMVKAFSYGSGGAEIASVLQYHNVDYLGVAYADEGVDLVKAGISVPVMVMNAEESSFRAIVDYNLQPVIYSPEMLAKFSAYLKDQGLSSFPVHVEVDTGMNRLGFSLSDLSAAVQDISEAGLIHVRSLFTHLAASEDAAQDDFTRQQSDLFDEAAAMVQKKLAYPFLQHLSNSAAIVRHPRLQKDMVRLGIGLYGIEIDEGRLLSLQPVATLRTTIAQLRMVKEGESVSYNRRESVARDSVIATVRIGYADGYSRRFSNGIGKMLVRGRLVPVTGIVCMDMTMIDVTDIPDVKEGDDVIVFGSGLPVQQAALWAGTIPYELMTSISQRVKRIYYHE